MSMSDPQSMSAEEARKLRRQQMRSDPRMWCRYNWNHPNDIEREYDFRTNDGEPLTYLVNDKGPFNPDQWADINILMMARGCLKTTSTIGITEWAVDSHPSCEAFMTAPHNDAVQEFMGKFKDLVHDTPLEQKRERDRFSHQKFKHNVRMGDDDDTTAIFSHLKSKSAWNADEGLRGPHSHIGIIDEFQDVDEKTMAMMLEMIDREIPDVPYFPTIFIIGTPKLKNSYFHKKWLQSNQREWDGDEQAWIDHDDVGAITADGVEGSFTIKGWKIDQYNSPLHDDARIEFKRQDRSEREFENEVLANFYSPEDDLLSEEHIRRCFDPDIGFRNTRQFEPSVSNVVITVDWGGGQGEDAADTVFMAGEAIESGEGMNDYECTLLDVDFLDHDLTGNQELERVREWISRYNPDHVLVDEGHNGTRRETLQDEYGNQTVHGCLYGNIKPTEDVRWHRNEAEQKVFATVHKTYVAESMVDAFKDGKFIIPSASFDADASTKNSFVRKLIEQLSAPYKDYDDTPSGQKKLKILSERNDDAFDTMTYLWCGIEHVHTGAELTDFSMGAMPGY